MNKSIKYFLVALSALLTVPVVAETAVYDRKAIELNSHTEVLIDLPVEQVWPYIIEDPKAWKQGPQLVSVAGSKGRKGEVFKAVMPSDSETALFYAKNVELITNQRRTLKLYAGSDGALIGFASWVLQEESDKTRVSYHVHSEARLPDEMWLQMTVEQREAYGEQNQQTNEKRFQDELDSLKLMAEEAGNKAVQ